jgi:hypothetical protein
MGAYHPEAIRAWQRARQKAFWSSVFSRLRGQPQALISFTDLSQRLHLRSAVYRGIQIIPIDKIIGSVGRYDDFNRAFLPTRESNRHRWLGVASLNLRITKGGAPPIDVFKVAEFYFVKDGNHRVSVARQFDMPDIEAAVWEYTDALPSPIPDINTLLLEAERRDFLGQTTLDRLRPHQDIRLTVPGGYFTMLCEITHYQEALSHIDQTEVSYEEAVTGWFDMHYEPIAQLIEDSGVIAMFSNRTCADFFIWTTQEHQRLVKRYGRSVMFGEAIEEFQKRELGGFINRVRDLLARMLRRKTLED